MDTDFRRRRRTVASIRRALDHHNADCPVPATAIFLNPVDHGRLAIDVLWGLDVRTDDRVRPKRCRILCDGSAWCIEHDIVTYLQQPEEDQLADSGGLRAEPHPHAHVRCAGPHRLPRGAGSGRSP